MQTGLIKLVDAEQSTVSNAILLKQLEAARRSLVVVDAKLPGTCIDERPRRGTRGDLSQPQPRFSAPGGPDIYALYVATLIGLFNQKHAEDRLRSIKKLINAAGIVSGGHDNCAANAALPLILQKIADRLPEIETYARRNLGKDFDAAVLNRICTNAELAVSSQVYDNWSEAILESVLGDEAENAIEVLEDVPHQARSFIRVSIPDRTVDQTKLHQLAGQDSFVNDDTYEAKIEAAVAAMSRNPAAAQLARHAREAVLAAVILALPNPELHQIELTA